MAKQTGIALLILILGAFVVGLWASYAHAPAPHETEQHVLMGVATSTGQMEYREESDCFDIVADYPATTSLPAAGDAKARIAIETELAKQITQFKKDNDVSDRDPEQTKALGICTDHKFTLQLTYKQYAGQGTVSYFYTAYADSLGAHPNLYFVTFVFDQNGDPVTLAQVLNKNPNWLEELSLLVSQDVQKQLIARLGASNLPQGPEGPDVTGAMFPEGVAPKAENFQNFVIDGDTLVIEIPPYQVAAWAAGTFEVRIPLSEINK